MKTSEHLKDILEKARKVGDTKVGKDGKQRVWTKTPSGYDWRRVKGSGDKSAGSKATASTSKKKDVKKPLPKSGKPQGAIKKNSIADKKPKDNSIGKMISINNDVNLISMSDLKDKKLEVVDVKNVEFASGSKKYYIVNFDGVQREISEDLASIDDGVTVERNDDSNSKSEQEDEEILQERLNRIDGDPSGFKGAGEQVVIRKLKNSENYEDFKQKLSDSFLGKQKMGNWGKYKVEEKDISNYANKIWGKKEDDFKLDVKDIENKIPEPDVTIAVLQDIEVDNENKIININRLASRESRHPGEYGKRGLKAAKKLDEWENDVTDKLSKYNYTIHFSAKIDEVQKALETFNL